MLEFCNRIVDCIALQKSIKIPGC